MTKPLDYVMCAGIRCRVVRLNAWLREAGSGPMPLHTGYEAQQTKKRVKKVPRVRTPEEMREHARLAAKARWADRGPLTGHRKENEEREG